MSFPLRRKRLRWQRWRRNKHEKGTYPISSAPITKYYISSGTVSHLWTVPLLFLCGDCLLAAALDFLGFEIYATSGTAAVLKDSFVEVNEVNPLDGESPNIQELLESGEVKLLINTPTKGRRATSDGFKMRRMAVEHRIPCMTSLDTAKALVHCLKLRKSDKELEPFDLREITNA